MELAVVALLVVTGALLVGLLMQGRRGRSTDGGEVAREVEAVRDEMRLMSERLATEASGLSRRIEGIDTRMSQSQVSNADLARGIFDTLGDVRRATTSVAEQAREFTSLQDLLKAPKARGGLGEAMLEELLRQVLPPQAFSMQHRFTSGATVDAVVRAGGRVVCVDSKFPLSNYRRMCAATEEGERAEAERAFAADVDRHIKDISIRYVVPDEGTFDFAVMYVPAEGVYAEVLRLAHRKRPLFESALESRVVPMSPLTLFGYLQTVLFGLKCLRIEQSAEAILGHCGRLGQDLTRFATEYETLGKHLGNARAKYEEGQRRLDRFRDKLDSVVDLGAGDLDTPPSLEVVND